MVHYQNLRSRKQPILFFVNGKFWVNNHAHILLGKNGNSTRYLYYALKESDIGSYLSGSTRPKLTQGDLKRILVRCPAPSVQESIAQILGTLDEKIELNRRINETLEAMARALFKSWFVDFDPVIDNALRAGNPIPEELRGKAARRKQILQSEKYPPLPPEIATLFPNSFKDSEIGAIPTGWEAIPFGNLLQKTIGGDWGKEKRDAKHTKNCVIIRGTDIPGLMSGIRSNAPLRWVEEAKIEKRELKDGDIVIEISGGSPKQSTGRSVYISEHILARLGGKVAPASFCRLFRARTKELGLLCGQHLSYIFIRGKMWGYQNQSTGISNFQTNTFLSNELIPIPSNKKVLELFYEKCRSFIDLVHSNESIYLARIRDTLLPKLISGKLKVPDVEKLVGESGV